MVAMVEALVTGDGSNNTRSIRNCRIVPLAPVSPVLLVAIFHRAANRHHPHGVPMAVVAAEAAEPDARVNLWLGGGGAGGHCRRRKHDRHHRRHLPTENGRWWWQRVCDDGQAVAVAKWGGGG
eukprot:2597446-Pyramimonas_sp.AAC.1